MIVALGVMLVTMLLTAAVFAAVQGDASLSRSDLDGKRAYSAAQAGLQAYLGELNSNALTSTWWETCSNDTASTVTVPGSGDETYSYSPVISGCSTSGAVGTVVDATTGLLRMEFTGKAGTHGAQRTIVADFRPLSPLSFIWYTVHETVNPAIDSACPSGTNDYANSTVPSDCWIYWATGDTVSGPMYTEDQFLVKSGATPYFGRASSSDAIQSPQSSLCVVDSGGSQPVASTTSTTCPTGIVRGKAEPSSEDVPLPSDNSNLSNDAASHGLTLRGGTTTLTLAKNTSGDTVIASGATCTSSKCYSTAANGNNLAGTDLTTYPLVYAPSATSGCTPSYSPTAVSYAQESSGTYSGDFYGDCGDLYVQGTYSTSLTLASASSIVVTGNLENSTDTDGSTSPSGSATLGLVADSYVRVYHAVTRTTSSNNNNGKHASGQGNGGSSNCSGAASNLTIDAAILALNNSFYVDNYDCGTSATLTIHGSMAQQYRGVVATSDSSGNITTGYVKNYVYDDRLKVILPPYVFDLQSAAWNVARETLCATGQASSSIQSCSYTGTAG